MSDKYQNFIIDPQTLNLDQLLQLQQKPAPFTPGEPLFWNDLHISEHLLKVHLDPNNGAASRHPEIIEQTVDWLVDYLRLDAGDAVLDMGCGPGLYASRFAGHGLHVTGVDYSQRSIDYATRYAREHNLDIEYRFQNYLTLEDTDQYDAVLLIYGDFCPLSPENRARLLKNVHRALKAGGCFVLDVSTREHRKRYGLGNSWYAVESGFWKPGPHLVLEQGFDYPDEAIYLDQFTVIEADGTISVYRNWFQDYVPESITAELEAGGFTVQNIWDDLKGSPYASNSEWIGVVACKQGVNKE